jgi:protocatechuate 4,5-dioxygenase alpha chain
VFASPLRGRAGSSRRLHDPAPDVHTILAPARDDTVIMTWEETPIFDSRAAMLGYGLNRMCFSFNEQRNREAFQRNEEAYMDAYDLDTAQRAAVRARSVHDLIEAGGNIYDLAKLTGIFGPGVQDIGAQQTGVSVDEFKARLLAEAHA